MSRRPAAEARRRRSPRAREQSRQWAVPKAVLGAVPARQYKLKFRSRRPWAQCRHTARRWHETVHFFQNCAWRRFGGLCRRLPKRAARHSSDDAGTGESAPRKSGSEDLQRSNQSVRLSLQRPPDGRVEPQSGRLRPVGLRRRGRRQLVTATCAGSPGFLNAPRSGCGYRPVELCSWLRCARC